MSDRHSFTAVFIWDFIDYMAIGFAQRVIPETIFNLLKVKVLIVLTMLLSACFYESAPDVKAVNVNWLQDPIEHQILDVAEMQTIHPDNQTIAYVSHQGDEKSLLIQRPNQAIKKVLSFAASASNFRVSWSPSGAQLIIGWRDEGYSITLMRFDENDQESLTPLIVNNPAYYFSDVKWLNEEQLLVCRSLLTTYKPNLYVLDLASMSYLAFGGSAVIGDSFNISQLSVRDGYVATLQHIEGGRRIRLFDPQKTDLLSLDTSLHVFGIALLPNLSGVLLSTHQGMKVLTLNGEFTDLNWSQLGRLTHMAFSSDGQQLYAIQYVENMNIWRREVVPLPLEMEAVVHTQTRDKWATCKQDSHDFIYVSSRSGFSQIWWQHEGENEPLTQYTEENHLSHLKLTQNLKSMAYLRNQQLELLDLKTRQTRVLLADSPNARPMGFDARDEHLYFSNDSAESGDKNLSVWRYQLSSGQIEKLFAHKPEQTIMSGGELYYLNAKDYLLYRWRPEGPISFQGEFHPRTRFIAQNDQYLFYVVQRTSLRRVLWRYHKELALREVAMKEDDYQGVITDICNDNLAFIELDKKANKNVIRIHAKPVTPSKAERELN